MDVQSRSNWTSKTINYLKNVTITEFDLQNGGLSVIKEYSLLSNKYITQLEEMGKEQRNIVIGKLQAKVPTLAKNMVIGFGKARQLFVDQNNINDEAILSIKKDALFIINPKNIISKVGNNFNFRSKNNYSSYIKLNNKEFYFSSLTKEMDIKGLSDENKAYQEKYLLKDIKTFLNQSEKVNSEQLFLNLRKYRSQYLNRELPIETYRNLDTGLFSLEDFDIDTVDEEYISEIDISYNYINYVLPLIQLLIN